MSSSCPRSRLSIALVCLALAVMLPGRANGSPRAPDLDAALNGYARLAGEFRPAYLADRALAQGTKGLQRQDGGDAGPFLNPKVSWDSKPPRTGALALPQQTIAERDWDRAEKLAPALDFSWMRELSQYGYWELDDPHAGSTSTEWSQAPLPNFIELLAWGRLRLAGAVAKGELGPALNEVTQLARLCSSTEVLIGSVVGAKLLELEVDAIDRARRLGRPVPAATPLTRSQAEALMRVLRGGHFFFHLAAPDEPRKTLVTAPVPALGDCTLLSEAILFTQLLGPLEGTSLAEARKQIDAALQRPPPGCRLKLARRYAGSARKAAGERGVHAARVLSSLSTRAQFEAIWPKSR